MISSSDRINNKSIIRESGGGGLTKGGLLGESDISYYPIKITIMIDRTSKLYI